MKSSTPKQITAIPSTSQQANVSAVRFRPQPHFDFIAETARLVHPLPMTETQAPPPLPKSQPSFGQRHSTIIKLLGVGALVLVLLIPLAMITGVLSERLRRRNE